MTSQYHLAKQIIARAFPHERLLPQSANKWRGEFPLPNEVAHYYSALGPVDVTLDDYGNPFFLPSLARLWEFQAGYRYHPGTKERFADWLDDWLVIANQGGDPFIYSRSSGTILHALHGQGVWEADELFANLEQMVTAFAIIGGVVVGAGEDLPDTEGYLKGEHVAAARASLVRWLGSEAKADVMLASLGWVGRS